METLTMQELKPETKVISTAMYELSETIQSTDGVANAACAQAAERLDFQTVEIMRLKAQLAAAEKSGVIPVENQRDLLIYAFRCTLGRMTYAPHTVIGVIRNSWNELSLHDRELIQREIREAIKLDRAGMDYDVKAWATLLELPNA